MNIFYIMALSSAALFWAAVVIWLIVTQKMPSLEFDLFKTIKSNTIGLNDSDSNSNIY